MSVVLRMALIGVVGIVLVVGLLWAFQRRLIYLPAQAVPHLEHVLPGAEEVDLVTHDGLRLIAWFVPPSTGDTGVTVIVFPGNAGNRAGRVPLARALAAEGAAVLLVDYRGYGGNPGRPTESGLAADARAALAHLVDRPDVDPSRIVYFGESLGAGVASGLAANHPPAALILRSPFVSLPEVASVHYPWLPVSWLMWDRYPVGERVAGLEVPLLVIASADDSIVPLSQSVAVFDAAQGPKRLLVIDGADHNDAVLGEGDEMIDAIVTFIEQAVDPSS